MPLEAAKIERLYSPASRKPRHIPWLIAIAGMLVSTLGFVHLQDRTSNESEVRLAREASNVTGSIQARLNDAIGGLTATRAFIENSHAVSADEFAGFVREVFRSDNTVSAIAWVRAEGDGVHTMVAPGTTRSEAVQLTIGVGLAAAIKEAEAGRFGIRANIPAEELGGEGEPLLAIAIPASDSANAGVVIGLIRPERLATIDWAASRSGLLSVTMRPARAEEPDAVISLKAADISMPGRELVETVRSFDIAGQEWQARSLGAPVAAHELLGFSPMMMLIAGMTLTAAIAGHLWSNQRRAGEIARLIGMLRHTNAELTERVQERDEIGNTLRASEWKYRQVIDGVSDVIFECNSAGRLSLLNDAWVQITGCSLAQSLSASLFDFIHEEDEHALRSYFTSFITKDASPAVVELRLRTADGGLRTVEIVARKLDTPLGSAGHIVGMIKDVTERRHAEAALHEAEHRYRAIVENALDGIFQSLPEGRFLNVNPALAKMLGYDGPDDLISSITDLGKQLYVDQDQRAEFMRRLDSGAVTGEEIELFRKDGVTIWAAVSARAVRGPSGQITCYEGTIKEVTERKHAETALRAAKEQADMASRTKSEFLANMSHELRTPLNAIIGFSEIIKDQMFGPIGRDDYAEYARDIFESGRHLLELINDILDMSKIEAGKRELNESAIDLNRVVMACLRLIRPRAEAAALKIVTDLPSGLNYLRAEELALKQILLNLLSNAVKFTPEGGEVKLAARIEADGAMLIMVSDTGIGIAKQDMAKALSPFGQIDSALSRQASGTGLGLTLVQSLVALHDGRFHLQSEVGAGTTAFVWLPATRVLREVA